jgi:hypothetical protein
MITTHAPLISVLLENAHTFSHAMTRTLALKTNARTDNAHSNKRHAMTTTSAPLILAMLKQDVLTPRLLAMITTHAQLIHVTTPQDVSTLQNLVMTTTRQLMTSALMENALTLLRTVTIPTSAQLIHATTQLDFACTFQLLQRTQINAQSELVMLTRELLTLSEIAKTQTNALLTTVMQQRDANLFQSLFLKTALLNQQDAMVTIFASNCSQSDVSKFQLEFADQRSIMNAILKMV